MVNRTKDLVVRVVSVPLFFVCVTSGGLASVIHAAETPRTATSPAAQTATSPTPGAPSITKDDCRVLDRVASGDLEPVKSLTAEQDAAFGRQLSDYVSCLAVARNSSTHCDSLPKARRSACVSQWQSVDKLKTLPKGQSAVPIVAPALHETCKQQVPKEVCEKIQEAIAAGDAARCKGLPERPGAFCEAVVTGDVNHCKDDGCEEIAVTLAKLKKDGLSGYEGDGGPAAFAAVQKGEGACAPVLAGLQTQCGGKQK